MKTNLIQTTLGLLAMTLPILNCPAEVVTYQFNTVLEADSSIAALSPQGLNNRGDIIVWTRGTDGQMTLWLADRRSTLPVVQSPQPIGRSTRCLSDSGRVAFLLADQDPVTGGARSRVVVASATGWTTLMEAHPASDGMNLGAPVINNDGWVAVRISGRGRAQIVMTDGVSPATVIDLPGATAVLSAPEINNEDAVAYERTDFADTEHGIYLWQAGAGVRVFNPNSQPGEFSRRLSAAPLALNDFASVAVRTLAFATVPLPDGTLVERVVTNRIVRVDGGVVTTIAQRSDDFRPATGFSLNNAGEVAFLAHDAQGAGTLYVGNGIETRRVVAAGDVLGERSVLRVDPAVLLNERGQVVFLATYADGGRAVVRATPRVVQ